MRTRVTYDSLGEDDKAALYDSMRARLIGGESREDAATNEARYVCSELLKEGFAPGDESEWAARLIEVADAIADTGCPVGCGTPNGAATEFVGLAMSRTPEEAAWRVACLAHIEAIKEGTQWER